jgi:hypothetical protein
MVLVVAIGIIVGVHDNLILRCWRNFCLSHSLLG